MTKWAYLGTAAALAAVAGLTGQLGWLYGAGLMALAAGLRLANDRRRAREAADRERR